MLIESVVQGPEVGTFETEFARLVGGRHCVAVNSGASALQLSLLGLGIGSGDEVVVPAFSYPTAANAVRSVGATPVFADIERDSFCLDADAVSAAVTSRTAAVIPVHLFGHPAAMDRLCAVAQRHGLAVVEDATEAPMATVRGRAVGTFGAAAVFSFGEGGVVATGDDNLARALRILRGQETDVRLTDVAAEAGREELRRLPESTERRRANASVLDKKLKGVAVPSVAVGAQHVYHQYTVRVPGNGRPDRDAFAKALAARGVRSTVHFPTPVNRLRAYRIEADLPETERAAEQVLSLPVHPGLSRRELGRVISACNKLGGLL
ncbi:DegT/DnrJ/EryC1/StrS family aminotransferase [Wenjunlia tyrosinilytica]|uniref:Aminotransferase DegT n=1 Tax=Wenjunlia tyrosinilytica TaxID=1544741 RepID=A0A917ZU15_9ACTN|nr:DegT/DnrJ/EryC1/StrS family aminotransferase [Wenjunlia tyrosinilytica]GGO91600.1 aminotransferase DegT [Wenjunlia tyrosinilytica]